jgi:hypothetical protein
MPNPDDVKQLVREHATLPEPMETAIRIRQDQPNDVWLLEIIPEFGPVERAERPINFNPGRVFPHPLHLIAGNRADIESALKRDKQLASWVARGEVLHGEDSGRKLVETAAELIDG